MAVFRRLSPPPTAAAYAYACAVLTGLLAACCCCCTSASSSAAATTTAAAFAPAARRPFLHSAAAARCRRRADLGLDRGGGNGHGGHRTWKPATSRAKAKAGRWSLWSSAGNKDDGDGGSGVFYDADPTAMNAAYLSSRPQQARQSESSSSSLAAEQSDAPTTKERAAAQQKSRQKFVHPPGTLPRDVVIVGSGLAGLSAALRLATATSHHVTLLEREDPLGGQMAKTAAGSFAAAGMLAPQSERLPSGPLLELCLRSREMYAQWVGEVESLARNSGEEGRKYLWDDAKSRQVSNVHSGKRKGGKGGEDDDEDEPWNVGYTATGGFLAPAFAGDSVATWAPPPSAKDGRPTSVKWLDAVQVRELEPLLHPEVVGGWWFPEDASVDARKLTCALRAACVGRGVDLWSGEGNECVGLELSDGLCKGIRLASGRTLSAKSVVLANGSWMRDLLPVPVVPHKGQSLSLRMPPDNDGVGGKPALLKRVLFAQDTYIVPKSDGRVVVGATVEAGSFDSSVTPSGLSHVMAGACRLVPALADLPVEETWAGLRPTTPDKGPILGSVGELGENLYVAGGYWRNGVLLAPKTGQLLGDLIASDRARAAAAGGGAPAEDGEGGEGGEEGEGNAAGNLLLTPEDRSLLAAFAWNRFTSPEGGTKLAADARYAASMHPVHKYSTGMGVSAAVGTELGFYSDAAAAKAERARDREAMFAEDAEGGEGGGFNTGSEEDAFERAARMGRDDAKAFTLGDSTPAEEDEELSSEKVARASERRHVAGGEPFNKAEAPDAYTVGMSGSSTSGASAAAAAAAAASASGDAAATKKGGALTYDDVYKKASRVRTASGERKEAEDSIVRAERIPDLRERQVEEQKGYIDAFTHPEILDEAAAEQRAAEQAAEGGKPSYDETTYDGYQAILEKNWGASRDDVRARMKAARMSNRAKASTIDESKIGLTEMPEDLPDVSSPERQPMPDAADVISPREELFAPSEEGASADLTSVYGKIAANKARAASSASSEMEDTAADDDRPDPGFRIHRVDSETGEHREIPPYTRPEVFAAGLEEEKAAKAKAAEAEAEAEVGAEAEAEAGTKAAGVATGGAAAPSDAEGLAGPAGDIVGETEEAEVEKKEDYDETTYDGYQAILEKNWGASQEDVKARMKAARMSNRAKASTIDESKIGVMEMPDSDDDDAGRGETAHAATAGGSSAEEESPGAEDDAEDTKDLSALYEGILSNKRRAFAAEDDAAAAEMGETLPDGRPDPGFRIYHVDAETGERREIPPYTKPEAFAATIEEEKEKERAAGEQAAGAGGADGGMKETEEEASQA